MAIGTASKLDIRIHHLVAPNKCYDFFRAKKWPHGVCCPKCHQNLMGLNLSNSQIAVELDLH